MFELGGTLFVSLGYRYDMDDLALELQFGLYVNHQFNCSVFSFRDTARFPRRRDNDVSVQYPSPDKLAGHLDPL